MKGKLPRQLKTLTTIVLAITFFFAISVAAYAATDIVFTTNGASNNYIPGSSVIVYGILENTGIGVPYTSVFVEAELGGKSIFYGAVNTDGAGYFKTGFNIPSNASAVGQTLIIRINNSNEQSFVIQSRESVISDTDPFDLVGFVPAGSLNGPPTEATISYDANRLGLVFTKNVNYFRNSSAVEHLQYIDVIVTNMDCFTLYDANNRRVPIQVSLISSGGDDVVQYEVAGESRVGNTYGKRIIYLDVLESLQPDSQYRLVVNGALVSNSSIPLNKTVTVYYRTTKSGEPTPSPGGGGGGGADAVKNSVELAFPASGSLTVRNEQVKDADQLVLQGSDRSLVFNLGALDAIRAISGGASFKVDLKSVTNAEMNSAARQTVGTRPVYDLALTSGSKTISDFGSGKVTVTLPYTLAAGETANRIGAYLINEEGDAVLFTDSSYDATTKQLIFSVTMPCRFAIGMSEESQPEITPITTPIMLFNDVSGWAAEYIYYLAERGIINGKREGVFAPEDPITRAEIVAILARMSGADLDSYSDSAFVDVQADDWFARSVAWAAAQNVVEGDNLGNFNPNANITRQDLCTMLSRYLSSVARFNLPVAQDPVVFADAEQVHSYAQAAVTEMQRAGIVSGKGDLRFAPLDNATRAEAAKIIALIMQAQ